MLLFEEDPMRHRNDPANASIVEDFRAYGDPFGVNGDDVDDDLGSDDDLGADDEHDSDEDLASNLLVDDSVADANWLPSGQGKQLKSGRDLKICKSCVIYRW